MGFLAHFHEWRGFSIEEGGLNNCLLHWYLAEAEQLRNCLLICSLFEHSQKNCDTDILSLIFGTPMKSFSKYE